MEKLSDETYIHCLMYLRAVDLAVVMELNKAARPRVAIAVKRMMEETPMLPHHNSPCRKQLLQAYALYRPESLFIFEVSSVLSALAFPQPLFGKGYWISASWASNAKKYFEALSLPDISSFPPSNTMAKVSLSANGNKSPSSAARKSFTSPGSHSNSSAKKKQQTKIRQRRGSDALPPWPVINADLLCCHDNLALSKVPKAKRRAIDSRAWFLLRKYYPQGPQFKCKTALECSVCAGEDESTKVMAAERRETEIAQRRGNYLPTALMALSMRKHGVPSHCLTASNVYLVEGDDGEGGITLEPLVYHPAASASQSSLSGSYLTTGSWPPQTTLSSSGMESAYSTASAMDDWIIQEAEQSAGHTTAGTSTPLGNEHHHNHSMNNNNNHSNHHSGPPPAASYQEYSVSPLVAGLYNLVPREWLRQWRRYTKDPSVHTLPMLDCTSLLCYAHGLLLIPPHLEDYLVSLKRSLLSGLGSYPGEVVEIVTAEEWDALQVIAHQHQRRSVAGLSPPPRSLMTSTGVSQMVGTSGASRSAGEFGVRFCLDSEGHVSWSLPVCHLCDPFSIAEQHHPHPHLLPAVLSLR